MTPFAVSTASGAGARLRREIVATFALCWPIVLTNLAMNLMTTTDVMMLGWLSPEALAAGSLGFNLYLPLMLFCVGVVGAAAPIAAARIGADSADTEGVRRIGHQALISSLLLALPVWAILWNAAPILRAIGEPPAARGERRALRARLAMGGGAAAADVLHAIDLRRAQPDRPGPGRQPDRGRLQRAGELRLDLRPFRSAGVGDIRVGPGDQPLASAHVFAAGRLFLPRSAHAVGRTVLAPLALSRGLARATLAPRSADRRDHRGRDFGVLVVGPGDGPDRARLDRGARDRRSDRRDHVHGPARARTGRERARRPRVRRAQSAPRSRSRDGRRSG